MKSRRESDERLFPYDPQIINYLVQSTLKVLRSLYSDVLPGL